MRLSSCVAALPLALLPGCASLSIDRNMESVASFSRDKLGAEARLSRSGEERERARSEAAKLLDKPLSADDAVRIAVMQSPALQSLLFENAAASAQATQSARLPNPIFTFERLVRRENGGLEKEIGRMLAFSVVDVVFLPARLGALEYRQDQLRLAAAGEVLQAAAEARQAWVRAVAAGQSLTYFRQVKGAAEASAELARRMQSAGNFSKLQRAREHAFYADAAAQLARAEQVATSTYEALVRALGLDVAQAALLKLPERLPDLPAAPDDEAAIARFALAERLDVRRAKAQLEFLARQNGLTRVTSYIDGLHLAGVRNSETGRAPQKGFQIELPLPIFDFGDAQRAAAQASYMAALNRTARIAGDATSQVREGYAGYRTAYDLARHYRDEVVPLRKTIAEEMLLKYNGMLIGVFELLADSREQIASVIQSIEAQRDFWLADAGLRATLLGKPIAPATAEARSSAPASSGERH
jgi:outer membrane protein TolC